MRQKARAMSSTSRAGVLTAPAVLSLDSAAGVSWTVEPASQLPADWAAIGAQPCPARVPGEVHVDLLTAGLIPDPFDGDNESVLAWIGRTDWIYRTTFEWGGSDHSRTDLVADGLDTVATIRLNGREVGSTANQHRGYRFEVSDGLVVGRNELEVAFAAPVLEAQRRAAETGDRPHLYPHPFNAIRKSAFSYGWDWGPDLAGVGIWKSLRLESWSVVRLGTVRPLAILDGMNGVLRVHADLEWSATQDQSSAQITVQVAGIDGSVHAQPGQTSAVVSLVVPDVQAWWPRGYGEQPRYDASVDLAVDDQRLGTWRGRVGFRTVALSTQADSAGSEFVIVVNETPIFVKGANWSPGDAFLTRLNRSTYQRAITDAVDAGMNMLRVWGGGCYETDDFYDVCDELGVLVWQDFLLACATYAEEQPLWGEFEAEARQAVARLAKHPSLVIWNGGNENIWGYVEWNWRVPLAGRTWGDGYYTELFPAIVAELDPRAEYTPGSPFSFAKYHHPNDHRHGTTHVWDVWNQVDYRHYRDQPARFVSEMGFQGPPAWSTLASVVHDEPMDPNGAQMLVHQKAIDGNLKLSRGLGDHLPMWRTEPQVDIDDWHWTTQLNQARAVSYGIAHFRSHYPLNRGTLVWSLNDNWPVISWAAVDGHGSRKPLWYALRDLNADRFLTIQPRADSGAARPTLLLHNDSAVPWHGEVLIKRHRTVGGAEPLASQRSSFALAPRAATVIVIDDAVVSTSSPTEEYLVAEEESAAAAYWYFVEDPQLHLAAHAEAAEVTAEPTGSGFSVRVSASSLIKDLTLFPDRLDSAATVDTALVTLQAGQSHTFSVASQQAALNLPALTRKPVLRSANDPVAG
jgi:beta-mannosidase